MIPNNGNEATLAPIRAACKTRASSRTRLILSSNSQCLRLEMARKYHNAFMSWPLKRIDILAFTEISCDISTYRDGVIFRILCLQCKEVKWLLPVLVLVFWLEARVTTGHCMRMTLTEALHFYVHFIWIFTLERNNTIRSWWLTVELFTQSHRIFQIYLLHGFYFSLQFLTEEREAYESEVFTGWVKAPVVCTYTCPGRNWLTAKCSLRCSNGAAGWLYPTWRQKQRNKFQNETAASGVHGTEQNSPKWHPMIV